MAFKDKSVQIVISAEIAGALRAFDTATASINKFGMQIDLIGRAVSGVFDPLMKALTASVTAISAGMGLLTKSALEVGGGFETMMTRVSAVVGEGEQAFARLSEKAQQMGKELPITATQSAEAMLLLAQAGKKTDDILSIVQDTTALSIAQNYDLAATTDLVVSTMSMFGLTTEDSARVVDVFTNATNNSQLTMEKLSNGMSYVGDMAQAFSLSLEETVAMLALLSKSGLEGEKMATSLRAILINLKDPTSDAKTAMEGLGISLTDASGKMKQPITLLRELAAAGMGADEAIKIFNRRAIGAGINLVKFVKDLDAMVETLKKQESTQKMLNEMLATFENRLKEVASAIQAVLITAFGQIEEESKKVVQEITALIRAFDDWAKETRLFEKVLQALVEGFGLVYGNVDLFREALNSIDVDAVAAKFKSFAEGVRAMFNAMMDFASKVPWRWIIDNLETIAKIIVGGWAVGKVLGIVAAFTKFAAAIMLVTKGSALLSAAMTGATVVMGNFAAAQKMALADAMRLYVNTGQIAAGYAVVNGQLVALTAGMKGFAIATGAVLAKFALFVLAIYAAIKAWEILKAILSKFEWIQELGRRWDFLTEKIAKFMGIQTEAAKEAEKQEKITRENTIYLEAYTEAVNGSSDALASLPPRLKKLAEESIKAKKEAADLAAIMEETGDAAVSMVQKIVKQTEDQGKQVQRIAAILNSDIRDALASAGEGGVEKFMERFGKLPLEVQATIESAIAVVAGQMPELNAELGKMGESAQSFPDKLNDALNQSFTDFSKYAQDMIAKTQEIVAVTGINAKDAYDALDAELIARAEKIGKDLVEKMGNPAVAAVFVKRLRDMGAMGGNEMYVKIADAIDKANEKIKEFSNEAKSLLEKAMQEFDTAGTGVGNIAAETANYVAVVLKQGYESVVQLYDKSTKEMIATGDQAARIMGTTVGALVRTNDQIIRETGGQFIGQLATMEQATAATLRKVKAEAEFAGAELKDSLTEPLDVFANKTVRLVDDGMGNLQMKVVDLASAGSGITSGMVTPLEKTGEAAASASTAITAVGTATAGIASGMEHNLATIGDKTQVVADSMTALVQSAATHMQNLAMDAANTVGQLSSQVNTVYESISTSFSGVMEQLQNRIQQATQAIVSGVKAAADAFKETFGKAGAEAAQMMIDNINAHLKSAVPSLSATAAGIGESVGRAMGAAMEAQVQASISRIGAQLAAAGGGAE